MNRRLALPRAFAAPLALAVTAATVGVASLVAAPPALADPDPNGLAYTVYTDQFQDLGVIHLPSADALTLHHDIGSLGSVALTRNGGKGWIDKGMDAGFISTEDDARVYPLDSAHDVLGSSALVSCQGVRMLTMSPDDTQMAAFCHGDGKTVIFNTSTLSVSDNISVVPLSLAWSKDGSRLWIETASGMYTYVAGTLSAAPAAGQAYGDVRVLPDGRAMVLGALGASGQQIDFFTPGAGATYTDAIQAIPGGAFNEVEPEYTLNPAGTEIWAAAGGTLARRIRLSDLATLETLGVIDVNQHIVGLSMDPSGTRLISVSTPDDRTTYTTNVVDISNGFSASNVTSSTIPGNKNILLRGAPFVTTPAAPVTGFGWTGGIANTPMSFIASPTLAPGTTAAIYHWTWGDGTPDTFSSGPNTTHNFVSPSGGLGYAVSLQIVDSLGQGGPSTGSWDGSHWFFKGADSSFATKNVTVGTGTALTTQVNGQLSVPGGIPYMGHVNLKALLTPRSGAYTFASKIQFYVDANPVGPALSPFDNGTELEVDLNDQAVGDVGDHTIDAVYNGEPLNSIQPAQSNTVNVTVNPVTTHVSGTTEKPEYATGEDVTVTTALNSIYCAGGTYTIVVDGFSTKSHTPDPIAQTDSLTLSGIADGNHTVKVLWEPDAGFNICLSSVSAPFVVKVGTSATTTTLTGPATSTPGAVALSTAVTSPDGPPGAGDGTVVIKEGTTVLASAAVGAQGKNTISTSLSAIGVHHLVASYSETGPGYGPSSSAALTVTVGRGPAAPTITSLTSGPGALKAFCTLSADTGGAPVSGLVATATPLDAVNGKAIRIATNATACPQAIGGLVNGEAYSVTIAAVNVFGVGAPSAPKIGVAGVAKGVSLLLSKNPVPEGTSLLFYGYAVDHSAPLAHHKVVLSQRLKQTITLATVTTDATGRFHYSLKLKYTGAVRARTVVDGQTIYSKELLAKVAFVVKGLSAKASGGRVIVTGAITPGSPGQKERKTRVAVYRSDAAGKKGTYIGDAKLAVSAPGAGSTSFVYNHPVALLGSASYLYINPLGTTVNASTHVLIHVTGRPTSSAHAAGGDRVV